MKKVFIVISFIFSISSNAQSFVIKDLSNSIGNWDGKLTYLDYSSGKPYTMKANIKISLKENKSGYIMRYEYPDEPHANSVDTIYINNKQFGKEKIVQFKKINKSDFILVTKVEGEDGNDHQKAILRHTYSLDSVYFKIIKDVKFVGTEKWIKRHEYSFSKLQDTIKMYRIAKIKVNPTQLEQYKIALKEQMNAAISKESGVLSYTVVADKKDASSITIFEVYANVEAYQSHIQTTHFKKYKETVKDMVLSLELIDTELVMKIQKGE